MINHACKLQDVSSSLFHGGLLSFYRKEQAKQNFSHKIHCCSEIHALCEHNHAAEKKRENLGYMRDMMCSA